MYTVYDMRINRYLAISLGIGRRKADELVLGAQVKINGQIAKVSDTVSDGDKVVYNDQALLAKNQFTYLLFNKPIGYVCSRQGQGSSTIYQLLPSQYQHLRIAGRLDKDSSGLLFLTDDGQLIYDLTHPKTNKSKMYEVELSAPISDQAVTAITRGGVSLKDGISRFAVEKLSTNSLKITMHEGRNRQIRRTFEALGYQVAKLHRISIGPYKIGDLAPGKFQPINRP